MKRAILVAVLLAMPLPGCTDGQVKSANQAAQIACVTAAALCSSESLGLDSDRAVKACLDANRVCAAIDVLFVPRYQSVAIPPVELEPSP